MYPAEVTPDAPHSERRVHEVFSSLPDDWHVLWDVPFGLFGRPRFGQRQIDFVLLHEKEGIVVIEVKGGGIRVEHGEWFTKPLNDDWTPLGRSPFAQVSDAGGELSRYLSRELQIDRGCFARGVAFPDVCVSGPLAPDAPREIILDLDDLKRPASALHRICQKWGSNSLPPGALKKVIDLLRPSAEITVLGVTEVNSAAKEVERETRRQVAMLDDQLLVYSELLREERAIVLGGAGTGKTVMEVERAKQAVRTGSRTLLLCHRSSVRSFIVTLLGQNRERRGYDPSDAEPLDVATWQELERFAPPGPTLADRFLALRERVGTYGTLVIDEGQEFGAGHLEALSWLLDDPEHSPLYLFADPFQFSGLHIFGAPGQASVKRREMRGRFRWKPPFEGPTIVLSTNCRNTEPIASLANVFNPNDHARAVIQGPQPTIVTTVDRSPLDATFAQAAQLIQRQGFRPNQLLVVIVGSAVKDAMTVAGRMKLLLYDAKDVFRFPLTPKDVRIVVGTPDSVQGLEADVCLISYHHDRHDAVTVRDLYIAISRARACLYVIADCSEAELFELPHLVFEEENQGDDLLVEET